MSHNLLSSLALFLSLVILGFAVGWIVGLSVSPVVSIVVTSVTGAAATAVAAFHGGAEDEEGRLSRVRRNVSIIPLAIYVASLAIGATVSMQARAHGRFEADPSLAIVRWAAVGIDRTICAQRLFDLKYPPADADADVIREAVKDEQAVLYAEKLKMVSELERIVDLDDSRFLLELRSLSGYAQVKALLAESDDAAYLRGRVRELCAE